MAGRSTNGSVKADDVAPSAGECKTPSYKQRRHRRKPRRMTGEPGHHAEQFGNRNRLLIGGEQGCPGQPRSAATTPMISTMLRIPIIDRWARKLPIGSGQPLSARRINRMKLPLAPGP